ncbi:MAG: ABC transporter permease [Lachnospiraceae bacterium]|nr:ABC transporter permease [Lachnospiraceae bacterium]
MRKVLFILKRILVMIFTLFVVSFLLFMILRLTGTDPLHVIVGEKQNISEAAKESIRQQYHLNEPLLVQYGIWLKGAVTGDFGVDYVQKVPVTDLITGRLAVTIGMVVLSMLLSILIAIPLGIVSALRKNSALDHIISFLMLVTTSAPGFLVAMLMLVFLSRVVPGYKSVGTYANTAEFLERIIAPSLCLALGNVALIGRVTRNAMVEQLNSDYIETCKAKGIGYRRMVLSHALKNSIIPVFTISAMLVGAMIGASVLVEQIFSLPGLGSLLSTAVLKNNYPVIMALTLIILVIFQVVNLVADILYTWIDPRIKL